MNRSSIRRALVSITAAGFVAVAGCTTAIEGNALPAGTAAAYGQGPVIPEEPADWAVAALDPCALLVGAPVPAAGQAFVTKPHNCGLDYTLPDGTPDRLVVRVGMPFDTNDRAHSAPTTVGGLVAYMQRELDGNRYDPPSCLVDIPISAVRSVQVDAVSRGGDVESACVGTRAAAESVVARFGTPAALARTSGPTGLGRWHACDLLEAALGYTAQRDAFSSPAPDVCRASPAGVDPIDGPSVEIETEGAPDALAEPLTGDSIVALPLGQALQKDYSSFCELVFVAERLPGAPADYAALVMTVTQRDSPAPCADAVAAATKIQNTLTAPAPEAPAPPQRLGFSPGEPDDVMPVACGVFGNTTPDTCRAPRPAEVPTGARQVLDVASSGPVAPDVSCAILREAAEPVLGEVELAASGEAGCIALSPDGYFVTLGFFAEAAALEYCAADSGLESEELQIAGRFARRCAPSDGTYNLTLPALGTAPDVPGVLLIDGTLSNPRGDRSIDRPADEPRVRDLTTRITENVINRRLSG